MRRPDEPAPAAAGEGGGFIADLLVELKKEKETPEAAAAAEKEAHPEAPAALDYSLLYDNVQRFSRALGPVFAVHDQVCAQEKAAARRHSCLLVCLSACLLV